MIFLAISYHFSFTVRFDHIMYYRLVKNFFDVSSQFIADFSIILKSFESKQIEIDFDGN